MPEPATTSRDRKRGALRVLVYVVAWLAMAIPASVGIFFSSETQISVASHDAVISPTLSGYVTLRTGPFLPDVRMDSGAPLGVNVVLGKTEAGSIEEAVERYAFIASQPDAQIGLVTGALKRMAIDASVRGGLLALLPIGIWFLIGKNRRRQLLGHTRLRRIATSGLVIVVCTGAGVVLVNKSWQAGQPSVVDATTWLTLDEYLPGVPMPDEVRGIEIQGSLSAEGTRRLVMSAIDTYQSSHAFYAAARDRAADITVRDPGEGETVAILVSDRHDNIGMDPVVRAVADRAGATVVLDAGDDTSTGARWEAFSLDSLADAFEDFEHRYSIVGNHDSGDFVETYMADLGWTVATHEPIDTEPMGRFASFNDPRSSGLGNWRDQVGMTIGEKSAYIADILCASDRVGTLMVHDINMAKESLARGCVDLAVAGHIHVQTGPDAVLGENGEVGYQFTNGTTGGAAYAIAVGSKLRRAAEMSLITYRDGRPVGIQVVTLQTTGYFTVQDWVELTFELPPDGGGEAGVALPGGALAPADTDEDTSPAAPDRPTAPADPSPESQPGE
ncbi:metallophosphoesterase [Nocardioides sp. AE5]|uniref:metallophosphoesterase n=1 Tax=Nocardioides sp. AE5 TaxID=2962573 RepID=UPI002880FD01|nr:metallophosphoesterase [Nocardioides sp. AE5]MDT0200859.1 metallophosphoesterase [Nocardioides sp. AE5]